jgi:hypothetical protein
MARAHWFIGLIGIFLLASAGNAAARDRDIAVKAVKTGPVLVVDAEWTVRAPLGVVWDVMTDWDDMEKFLPSMQESEIVSREGNRCRVRQKGRVYLGPFPASFEATRDIDVFPGDRMRFKGVKGSFERLDGEVKLSPIEGGVRVNYRTESVPTVWVPPFVGASMVESSTRTQFGELRMEVLRRAATQVAGAPERPPRCGHAAVTPVPVDATSRQ